MAQSIRSNKNIKGIKLPQHESVEKVETKISMFADDTQLFLSSDDSIVESLKTLNIYCKASGAKLNMHKTKGINIGRWKNKEPKIKKISWVQNVKGLGTYFGYNINYEEIWLQKFTKFKSKIALWEKRDLTLEGKKLIINAYIMSSLLYLIDIYTTNIPKDFIRNTKDLIRDFLWNGKKWKISQKTIALRKEHGGIELQDLDNLIVCKKIKWLLKIHFSESSMWNTYGKYCLGRLDRMYDVKDFLMNCTNTSGLNSSLPKFYEVCLEAWQCIQRKNEVTKRDQILEQNLFGNHNITQNKQSLFLSNWAESGI